MTYYGGQIKQQKREQEKLKAALAKVEQAQSPASEVLAPLPAPDKQAKGPSSPAGRAVIAPQAGVEANAYAGSGGRDGLDGRDEPAGEPGKDGADGAPGLPGADGAPGAAGADGTQGSDGLPGADGTNGRDGVIGRDGVDGLDGRDGVDGAPGAQGLQGLQGVQGDPGLQGVQGVAGPKGDKGDKGDTGDRGDTGEKGDTGSQGAQGAQGLQGLQGIQGVQGVAGPKGDKGDTGDKGDKGDTGERGPQGTPSSGAWQEISRTTLARSNNGASVTLSVTGSYLMLRLTVVGAATTYTGARSLSLTVNSESTAMWEGNGIYQGKASLASPTTTWALNYSGGGNMHTGTSLGTNAPVGMIGPTTDARTNGTILISQDDLFTNYASDMSMQWRAASNSRFLANGYAAYTTAISSVTLTSYRLNGTFVLEGLVP